ncbi:beta glucosidase 15 [Hibiscus trionum]|uniref:Beta glucosidase 15 n=1 Tax=Hibiscus trionum TaxID=183268 RepID=A0A9W7JGA4_HIBTR|nr:beta glucosidase 15 [Hibiscus trionum]
MVSVPATCGKSVHCLIIFVLLACLSAHGQTTPACQKEYLNVKRSDFPIDFVFGSSTAAAQIEGSTKSEGKGPSVWDQFIREFPDKIIDKSNFDVAADSYNRYKEDVSNLKDLGVDSYRFSISWTRILHDGTLSGGINLKAIDHYNNFIDELIKNGIKPFVTIMHFDEPEALVNKYGGFLNHSIVNDFRDYAEICFITFGDRVKNWVTINEPLIMAKMGYALGVGPPGRCSDRKFCPHGNAATEPYIVAHNALLAHAAAANLYKQKYQATQGGQIGISLVAQYHEPYSDTPLDLKAAKRAMDFELGWFMEPLVRGKYPKSMRRLVKERLPVFSAEEKELVKGSFDFIGINYYSSRYAKHIPSSPNVMPPSYLVDSNVNVTVDKDGVPIGPNAGGSVFIYVYPKGLYKVLKFMKENYSKNLTIYITENGYTEKSNDNIPICQTLKDGIRIKFIQKHLYQLQKAIKKGVNVKGYFYYSLVDSFEWGEGYTVRYGLYHVDFKNLIRSPKESAEWYRKFIKGVGK